MTAYTVQAWMEEAADETGKHKHVLSDDKAKMYQSVERPEMFRALRSRPELQETIPAYRAFYGKPARIFVAWSLALSPDALRGQTHLGTVTTASTVDFQGPPLPQPSPPSPPSPLPPSWPQPPALPSVATCARAFWPSRPQCKKKRGLVTAISRAHCRVRRSSTSLVLWSI